MDACSFKIFSYFFFSFSFFLFGRRDGGVEEGEMKAKIQRHLLGLNTEKQNKFVRGAGRGGEGVKMERIYILDSLKFNIIPPGGSIRYINRKT